MSAFKKEKRAQRRMLRQRLSLRSAQARARDSHQAVSHFVNWLNTQPHCTTIALYAALPSELDLSFLLTLKPRVAWYFPLVTKDALTFYRTRQLSDLSPGAMGIDEPRPDQDMPLLPSQLDLILCPGLGFTREGGRLGRGGGFYDRFLENCSPHTLRVAACFAEQIVPDLPVEPHDAKMSHLLTEAGFYRAGSPLQELV